MTTSNHGQADALEAFQIVFMVAHVANFLGRHLIFFAKFGNE